MSTTGHQPSEGERPKATEPDARHALDIMLQQWNIQYHTTLGMNTRIAAALAFAGVTLGFDLRSDLFSERDFFAFSAAALLLIGITCFLWAARTRWAKRLPPAAQLAIDSVASAASSIEGLVQANQERLRQKSRWLNVGLCLTGIGILMLGAGVALDALSNPQAKPQPIERHPSNEPPHTRSVLILRQSSEANASLTRNIYG